MRRRALLKRILGLLPFSALAAASLPEAAGARPRPPTGTPVNITNIQVAGDFKGGDKLPNGEIIVVSFVRPESGLTGNIFLDPKTRIFFQGGRIRFRDLLDDLYARPQGVADVFRGLPFRFTLRRGQIARRIDIG